MVELITSSIGISTAVVIIYLIRKDRLHVHHGLWWISAAVVFVFLGFFPAIFDFLAAQVGVQYPPVLALMLGLALLVIKILKMDIDHSVHATKLARLVQRMGLLEAELEKVADRSTQREERQQNTPDQTGE